MNAKLTIRRTVRRPARNAGPQPLPEGAEGFAAALEQSWDRQIAVLRATEGCADFASVGARRVALDTLCEIAGTELALRERHAIREGR